MRGEMDHRGHLPFAHEALEPGRIGRAHHIQPFRRDVATVAAGKIVEDSDVVPAMKQYFRSMRSDITGAAGDQNVGGAREWHKPIVIGWRIHAKPSSPCPSRSAAVCRRLPSGGRQCRLAKLMDVRRRILQRIWWGKR